MRDRRRAEHVAIALAIALALSAAACGSTGLKATADASASDAPGSDAPLTADAADASPEGAPARDAGGDAGAAEGGADGSACGPGGTVVVDGTSCPGAPVPTPQSWTSAISAADAGQVVMLDTATLDSTPCLPVTVCVFSSGLSAAPTLLFSDSPETPSTDGVLYADTVGPGNFRFYVYQANGGTAARKFPIVVLNEGTSDAHVSVGQRGLGGTPSTDYVAVGKAAVMGWLGVSPGSGVGTVTVPAGTRVLLDPALDALHANAQELVNAIYDVSLDAPLKVSFVSVLAGEDAAMLTASLPLLPRDPTHDRGTFPGAYRHLVASGSFDASSIRRLRLGAPPLDPPLTGKDATTGAAATLGGNYGVAYSLGVTPTHDYAAVIFARGGDWGGGATAPSGQPPFLALPSMQSALPAGMEAVVVYPLFSPHQSSGMLMMSAGGSSLPIDVAYVPMP